MKYFRSSTSTNSNTSNSNSNSSSSSNSSNINDSNSSDSNYSNSKINSSDSQSNTNNSNSVRNSNSSNSNSSKSYNNSSRNTNTALSFFPCSDGKPPKKCVDLSPGVSHFVGRFSPSSGVADGPGGRTVLEWDGSSLSGRVSRGSHVGRTVGADARGGVRFVGRYRAGRPDGPGWVFPPGSGDDDAGGFVFAWFKDGEILEDKVSSAKK